MIPAFDHPPEVMFARRMLDAAWLRTYRVRKGGRRHKRAVREIQRMERYVRKVEARLNVPWRTNFAYHACPPPIGWDVPDYSKLSWRYIP